MRDDLIRYIVQRIAFLPFFLLAASLLVFFMGRAAPGDPAILVAHQGASEETIQRVRHELGLDKPLPMQYVDYMKSFFTGDLGESFVLKPGENITDLLIPRLKISAPISLAALSIAFTIGTVIGLTASFKRNSWLDPFLISSSLFFAAIPSLILVQFLILILSLKLNLVPAGWTGDWHSIFTSKMIIPVLTLSLISIAGVARLVRTLTLSVIDANYVRTARAKGLPSHIVALKYVLRNSLLPLITMIIPAVFLVFEGSFFVERIYGIPGTGVLAVEAVFARDHNVIMAMTMLFAMLWVTSNIVADILYKFADPRVDLTKRM